MTKENSPEDSMESIDVDLDEGEETRSTLTPYRKDFDQVDKMLSQAVNLNNESRLHEPTCPICCSPARVEAEDAWDGRKTLPIIQLIKERTGAKVSTEVVRHHMKNHMDNGGKEIRKVEFIDRVRRLYGSEGTTLDEIRLCIAVIRDRMMEINSLGPSGDDSEADIQKIKSAETNKLMSTYGNLIKLQATILGEMKDNGEIISIQRDKFITVFNEAFAEAKTDREREIVSGIINGLKG